MICYSITNMMSWGWDCDMTTTSWHRSRTVMMRWRTPKRREQWKIWARWKIMRRRQNTDMI